MKLTRSYITAHIKHYVDGSQTYQSPELDGAASDEALLLAHEDIGPRTEVIVIERRVRSSVDVDGNLVSVLSSPIGTPRQYKVDRFPSRTIRHGAIETPSHSKFKGILRIITHTIPKRASAA